MNSKFHFSRCDKCYQSTLVLVIVDNRTCKDCDPEIWEREAKAEKEAWLKGEEKRVS